MTVDAGQTIGEVTVFYEPKDGHGLPHNPFNAIVTPRPIGWIATRGSNGQDNLAPYSFFNAVAYVPPQVIFSSTTAKEDRGDTKDSVANIRETGVFCANIVSYALRDQMNATSAPLPAEVDEFERAGLEKTECNLIACSRVVAAPAALECKATQIVKLGGEANFLVVGEVVGVHMRDDCMTDGLLDPLKYLPLTRLGYQDYSHITDTFRLVRPKS